MPTFTGSDGAYLHYDESGPGSAAAPPLIALAGGAARHPSYLGDLAGLDTSQRLIVPHLRGVGLSPRPDAVEVGSFWRQAEDIECLRIHCGLEQVGLLGHSAGTRLAISYAVQFPDRLARMVLLTPPEKLARRLREVTAPVLVIGGSADRITGVAPVAALAQLFPAGMVVTVERCGHFPWVEQPAAFRHVVDRFLGVASGHPPGTAANS